MKKRATYGNRTIVHCAVQPIYLVVLVVAILPITRPAIACCRRIWLDSIPGLSKLNPEIPGLAKRSLPLRFDILCFIVSDNNNGRSRSCPKLRGHDLVKRANHTLLLIRCSSPSMEDVGRGIINELLKCISW